MKNICKSIYVSEKFILNFIRFKVSITWLPLTKTGLKSRDFRELAMVQLQPILKSRVIDSLTLLLAASFTVRLGWWLWVINKMSNKIYRNRMCVVKFCPNESETTAKICVFLPQQRTKEMFSYKLVDVIPFI